MSNNTAKSAPSGTEKMGTDKIPRLVLSFTATTLAGLVLNSVYSLTDALFVSWGIGDAAMGGVSAVFPFVILQGAIATAVGSGAASIVSRKLGAGQNAEAGEYTANAMAVFYITAAIVTVMGFALMEPLLSAMGATGNLYGYAKEYFVIVLAGNVFSTGFSSVIRAEGKMLYALLIWIIPIAVNIALDAVFVLGLKWGVAGSAAATVACQFTSFCMCVVFFARFSAQRFKRARIRFSRIGEILAVGIPSLIQTGSLSIMILIINNLLSKTAGEHGVTAFGYMSKLLTYAAVPVTALAQATAPIVGYNYGAEKFERVTRTVKFSAALCALYALPALALTEVIAEHLIMIFTDNNELISFAAYGLRIAAVALPFTAVPMLAGAAMQATGRKTASLFYYSAGLLCFIPLALGLARLGATGLWCAYTAAAAAAALLTVTGLYLSKRRVPYQAPPYSRIENETTRQRRSGH